MKINRIVKKNERDVVIYFDNSGSLILSLEIFLKSGLKKNDDISDNRLSSLITENKKYYLKQRGFRLLARRHHSILELKQKLLQKNYEPDLIRVVLEELVSAGYLDDRKFASIYVEEKLRTKSWGERKLKSELIKKGINSAIISELLKNHSTPEQNIELAEVLAAKKLKSLKLRNYDLQSLRKKISAFLVTRGFDYEIIHGVTRRILKDENQDD